MYRFFQDVEADSERTLREAPGKPVVAAEQAAAPRAVYGDMEDDSVSLRPENGAALS